MLEKYPDLAAVAKNNIATDIAPGRAAGVGRPWSQRMQKGDDHQPAVDHKVIDTVQPGLRQASTRWCSRAIATPHPTPADPATATPTTPTPTPTPSATSTVAPATDDLVNIKDAC